MTNTMNKRALILITLAGLVVSAVAMTAVAQEATTTAEEATMTPVVMEATSTATTTDAASPREREERSVLSTEPTPAEATESTAATSTLTTITEPDTTAQEATSTITVSTATSSTIQDISALQNSYFEKNGKYLQVLANNQLPDYETGSVSAKLGGTIPASAHVDVYESPQGFGYQVTYEDSGKIYTVGFGPEAESRTYSYPAPAPISATSTSSQ